MSKLKWKEHRFSDHDIIRWTAKDGVGGEYTVGPYVFDCDNRVFHYPVFHLRSGMGRYLGPRAATLWEAIALAQADA